MTAKTISFNSKDYTEASLKDLSTEELLELRNLVASNLGVAGIKSFKDHDTAVTQTWKALERFDSQSDDAGEEAPKAAKAKKAPKEPKERGLAKSAEAKVVKRPNKKMFSTITKTGEHDGSQGRAHRWPNYKDGMTIVDVIETEGTEPWDVYNWQSQGIMTVTEPTDAEFAERKAAWYAKHGLTDPEVAKEEKRKEREEAKAKREAEREAKKKEREEAKAAKAKEREEAKAKKEAEAKAKADAAEKTE